jgi:hypothetical protein
MYYILLFIFLYLYFSMDLILMLVLLTSFPQPNQIICIKLINWTFFLVLMTILNNFFVAILFMPPH